MYNNGINKFFSKVYFWMFLGTFLSGVTAYYTSITEGVRNIVYSNLGLILIIEFVLVIVSSLLINKISPMVAKILFMLYSIVSGLCLSSIFLVYKISSIGSVFLVATIMYVLMAIYGFTTKQDLTKLGKILFFALLAIIIVSVITIFVPNNSLSIGISIISVVVFLGLTAWDIQKLKMIYNGSTGNEIILEKAAIYGALQLYLDFINIFLDLLRLFGRERD